MTNEMTLPTHSSKVELAKSYILATSQVSLTLIQALNLQKLDTQKLIKQLSEQKQALELGELAASELTVDERTRLERMQSKLESTRRAIMVSENSQNILAGAVLQIAQQGMSSVHGRIKNYPNKGRDVYGAPLCDLVWQDRNQAMHYETTATKADWEDVFKIIGKSFPGQFDLTPPYKSHAKDIIDLLGWSRYSIYEVDVKSLLL